MNPLTKFSEQAGNSREKEFLAYAERKVLGLNIRCGGWIDAIQVIYTNKDGHEDSTDRFGGPGGGQHNMLLEKGETVTQVTITTGEYVNHICVETSLHKSYTYGNARGEAITFKVPEDSDFKGFYGSCGNYVNSIGILTLKKDSTEMPSVPGFGL